MALCTGMCMVEGGGVKREKEMHVSVCLYESGLACTYRQVWRPEDTLQFNF